MRSFRLPLLLVVFLSSFVVIAYSQSLPAQTPPTSLAPVATSSATAAHVPPDLADIVAKQFGPDFEIVMQPPFSKIVGATTMERDKLPWTPFFTGDLDGDGVEDAIIVARNKNALIGADAYQYKVLDPYNSYWGYGNAQVTVTFNANDPIHNMLLLIIHGAGAEGWRAATPKSKFVLMNIPFEQVSITRALTKMKKKKRTEIAAIRVEESDTISSLIFWDGKKYKYVPGGGTP
jgi:hypothetical protein